MITVYGMSPKFRNMTLGKRGGGYGGEPSLVREYSETTQQYIDEEIARIMDERYQHTLKMLTDHKELLEVIANRLLEVETMEGKEFYEIVENAERCKQMQAEQTQGNEVRTADNAQTENTNGQD